MKIGLFPTSEGTQTVTGVFAIAVCFVKPANNSNVNALLMPLLGLASVMLAPLTDSVPERGSGGGGGGGGRGRGERGRGG